jgi:hypothetical protein
MVYTRLNQVPGWWWAGGIIRTNSTGLLGRILDLAKTGSHTLLDYAATRILVALGHRCQDVRGVLRD